MHIPSRVQVLSWNENQVADLLREHHLLDCVDCVFQRHIDGQKLLNLREGDVMYFLEIHNIKSRGKFWNIVKQITEKKGGVQNLMKFQVGQESYEPNNNGAEEGELSDGSDSFDSEPSDEYDEPDPEETKPIMSVERQETIKRNLLMNLAAHTSTQPHVEYDEEYPGSEDIYDVPEDGCGEPEEDMYDVPSDESGGGVVRRHPALERKQSENYLVPDDGKLIQTQDEEDYEDLSGVPPPGHTEMDEQDDYVVPDTKPTAIVPPRPPKPSSNTNTNKPAPPPGGKVSQTGKNNAFTKLQAKFQEQEPPQPQRGSKNRMPTLSALSPVSQAPKPPPPKDKPRAAVPPLRIPNKNEIKKPPDTPDEPDQDEYEFPDVPPTAKKTAFNKPALVSKEPRGQTPPTTRKPPINKKPPAEPEQETYEPPDQPPRPTKKLPNKKPLVEPPQETYEPPDQPARPTKKLPNSKKFPIEPEQETYEPPDEPPRFGKKPVKKKPPVIEQENYEPPVTPARPKKVQPVVLEQENYESPELPSSKPGVCLDPEENYEAPDQMNLNDDEFEQEDYEIPDRADIPPPKEVKKSPRKSIKENARNLLHIPSKKTAPNVPAKADKKKTVKKEVPKPLPADDIQPPLRHPPKPAGNKLFGKLRGEKTIDRNSMALPNLPTDNVDARSPASQLPSLPPKPTDSPDQKEKLVPERRKPELPQSKSPQIKPPPKSKRGLHDQPWFHGSISKEAVCDMLRKAKQDGAYLVRNSSRDRGKCIMSIFYKNDIRHLNIPCDSNGHYRLGDSGVEKFKDVEELVTYFNKHDVEFSAGGKTPLTFACLKS